MTQLNQAAEAPEGVPTDGAREVSIDVEVNSEAQFFGPFSDRLVGNMRAVRTFQSTLGRSREPTAFSSRPAVQS